MVILESFLNLFNPYTLLAMTLGTAWGIFLGAMPGFGATIGMALLIPFTFGMNPNVALPMLAGVYQGAMYGGGITAILIGIPGTSAAAATVLDGFEMTKKGEANKALTACAMASSFGSIFGGIVLLLFAPMLVKITLLFGPAEYFVLAIFGLSIIAAFTGGSILKGLIAGAFGVLLSTVGIDPIGGDSRFTFDQPYLFDGFPLIPLILSLFAFPRCLSMIRESFRQKGVKIGSQNVGGGGPRLAWREFAGLWKTILRSGFWGAIIGIIPAAGGNIACWMSYAEAKRNSRYPEKFGTGITEGVVAAEMANSTTEGGALVPMLTLSIPGSPPAAIMLGALMIHGMVPGPDLFTKHALVTYTYMLSIIFSSFILLAMGYYGSRFFARVADVSPVVLAPIILLVTMMGAFATRQYVFDIGVTVGLGTVCYLLSLAKYPMPSILLGAILGPIAERGFRRAMLMSQDDWTIFFTRPICIILLIMIVISIHAGLRMSRLEKKLKA